MESKRQNGYEHINFSFYLIDSKFRVKDPHSLHILIFDSKYISFLIHY